MNICYRCHNQTDFTIIKNCVGCNYCKRIIYERIINRKSNKNKHLKHILREFNHFQPYHTRQLINEMYILCITNNFEITPKNIKLFLKQRNHTNWIFYYQFLNELNNIEFELSFNDKEIITYVFNRYYSLTRKNVSFKKLIPMIFKYLEMDFCIKPDYSKEFLDCISQISSDKTSFVKTNL